MNHKVVLPRQASEIIIQVKKVKHVYDRALVGGFEGSQAESVVIIGSELVERFYFVYIPVSFLRNGL